MERIWSAAPLGAALSNDPLKTATQPKTFLDRGRKSAKENFTTKNTKNTKKQSASALRRKPPKILGTRRAIPTCWIAAVSAAEEEKNASYRSLKKARVSLSHSERVPFCANSAFRIPNSELFRSLLFEPLNQFFIAAFFGAIQNGRFDCVFVVDFEWVLASVVFGVYIRSMLDQIFR